MTPPPTCDIALKEWAGVCSALVEGRQSLLLRKGGIADDPTTTWADRLAFWLLPTHVHEAEQGLKVAASAAPPPAGEILLKALAVVSSSAYVTDWERVEALSDFHVWTSESVRKRFDYRAPGLWALGVRVFVRDQPWRIEDDPAFGGCRTWVDLGRSLSTEGMRPALDESAFADEQAAWLRALGESARRSD